jgi:phosphoglycolate phosphatase-like HAD superfamily hydrolase
MSIKFKCLILDHDDTAVNSTAMIHYPAHRKVMEELRPDYPVISLRGWFEKNFHPGIMEYMKKDLGFTDREIQREYEIWREYTTTKVPEFFPGFIDALKRFKSFGGIITVVSHSEKDLILRDYRGADPEGRTVPDMVFGWDFDDNKRKPHPYPVERILQTFSLRPEEVLILDDLRPGVLMSRAAGVEIAGAGWGHDIPEIRNYMMKHCTAYFATVREFTDFLFTGR